MKGMDQQGPPSVCMGQSNYINLTKIARWTKKNDSQARLTSY